MEQGVYVGQRLSFGAAGKTRSQTVAKVANRTLSPYVDELVVAGITQSRGPKSDKRDAYGLAEKLRVGNLD